MSIYREPARMATIQLRKAAEERSVSPTIQPSRGGLLASKKMATKEMGDSRKTETARVLDIMLAVRESMNGEA